MTSTTKTLKEWKKECTRLDKLVNQEEYKLKCIQANEREHFKKGIELQIMELRLKHIAHNKIFEQHKEEAWQDFIQETDVQLAKKKKDIYNTWAKELSRTIRLQEKDYKDTRKTQQKIMHICDQMLREKQYDVDGSLWSLIKLRNEAYDIWHTEKKLYDEAKANKVYTKIVSKSRFETDMPDVCGICLEKHTTKDTIVTNCKHQFGQECFQRWIHCCTNTERPVSCPMCKKNKPNVFSFITRQPPPTTSIMK